MDTVFIKGLKARATIGVFDWERQIRQHVVLDIAMKTDVAAAARSDSMDDAVDYKEVARRVSELVETSSFQLVESLAEAVAALILKEFGVGWVRIRLGKPFAVRSAQDVGVTIERGTP